MAVISEIKLNFIPEKNVKKSELAVLGLPENVLKGFMDLPGDEIFTPCTLTVQRIDVHGTVLSNDVFEGKSVARFLGKASSCQLQFEQMLSAKKTEIPF